MGKVTAGSRKGTAQASGNSDSVLGKSKQFVSDSVSELKKVSPPTKQETIQATVVTMVILLIIAVYLALLDVVFGKLMGSVLIG